MQRVCQFVGYRAATLSALGIAAIVRKRSLIDGDKICHVGVDGMFAESWSIVYYLPSELMLRLVVIKKEAFEFRLIGLLSSTIQVRS